MRELSPMEDVAMAGGPEASGIQIMSIPMAYSVIQQYNQSLRDMNVTIPFLQSLAADADYYASILEPSEQFLADDKSDLSYECDPSDRPFFRAIVSSTTQNQMINHVDERHVTSLSSLLAGSPIEPNPLTSPFYWIASLSDKFSKFWGIPFRTYIAAYTDEALRLAGNRSYLGSYVTYPDMYYTDYRRLDGPSVSRISKKLTATMEWHQDNLLAATDPFSWPDYRCILCDTWQQLKSLASLFREAAPPTFLSASQYRGAPRHGNIKAGSLARLITEDLDEHAQHLIDMYANADRADRGSLQQKFSDIIDTLYRLEPAEVRLRFVGYTSDVRFADVDPLGNALLRQAYLAIAIHYTKDVQARMIDYAEASGQIPQQATYAININGGTINQVGHQIHNIDSSISTVLNQGHDQLGAALEAIKQAASGAPELCDNDRQDLLDNIKYLADAATTAPEQRNRGIVRSALSSINSAATAAPHLSQALASWRTILNTLA
ncbi:hypothetical protein [Nocardia sp. MW-W600-9]